MQRVGDIQGKRVVVNGAGPIGCLIIVSALAAGASEICVGDITDRALTIAAELGAHRVVNIAHDETLTPNADIVFEATGVPQALKQCFDCVRPGGKIVQVGMLPAGDISLDPARLVTREVDYLGSFRFLDEITDAVKLLAAGTDLTPMLTHTPSMSATQRPPSVPLSTERFRTR
ncbi:MULTISPECIES: zinc-binding dehydrogenase [Rhodococcus]|uniref:Zinc-binding dehydrogenase n=1 Tax=Rhodococcus baikonurensis TaxID=172041 RepID=A0ABV5XM52_9NOCA